MISKRSTAQGLDVEHLAKLRQLRQVALSPDGKLAAFASGVLAGALGEMAEPDDQLAEWGALP